MEVKTLGFDGNDEIIFSKSFNVYEDRLTIDDFLERKFKFVFENTEPIPNQQDINVTWSGNVATVTISKKFRNPLGSGTSEKLAVLKTSENKQILFSIFGQQVGNSKLLHITVNFYQR